MATKKLDTLISSIASKKTRASPHQKFSERSHLLRWFHERDTRELKAMQKALLALQASRSSTGK